MVVFIIRGSKTTKHGRSLSCFLGCTTRRKCQTNTSRSTLASLDSIQAEVGLTLFILVGLTPHFHLLQSTWTLQSISATKANEPETLNSVVVFREPPKLTSSLIELTGSGRLSTPAGLMNCLLIYIYHHLGTGGEISNLLLVPVSSFSF